MKEDLKRIQDYFITKIIVSDFEVINTSELTVTILIDNEYQFIFWIAKGVDRLEQFAGGRPNFIMLPEFPLVQRDSIYKSLTTRFLSFRKQQITKQRQAEDSILNNL